MIRFKEDVKFECIEHLLIYLYTSEGGELGCGGETKKPTYYSDGTTLQCNYSCLRSFGDLIQLIKYYFNVALSYEELAAIVCGIVIEDSEATATFKLFECDKVNDITIGLELGTYMSPYDMATYEEDDEDYGEGYTGGYRAKDLESEFFGEGVYQKNESELGKYRKENGKLFNLDEVYSKIIVTKGCTEI